MYHLTGLLAEIEPLLKTCAIMCFRGLVVYIFGIFLVKFNKKFIVIRTPFNFIVFIMLGSLVASAIAVDGLLIPILFTLTFLSFFNKCMAALKFHVPMFGRIFNEGPIYLVREGKIQWDVMRQHYITKEELLNEFQSQMHETNLDDIKYAILSSDRINFINK